ncbi:MAG: PTS mannose/fructose/sorbose transporter subunit IIB [Candidatus Dadabacteria bacterium]|nr:MAG: PTS mannose/fructose/sorbose transporter subunit IIB [Candidatus Dadabacteria bacterium]
MTLKLARIDDRLIHGQVIHGWLPRLDVDLLIVADRRLAENEEEQLISRVAVPESVDVRFIAPEELIMLLDVVQEHNTVILFRTPEAALDAVEHGFDLDALNLGNLHFEPGKMQLRKTFCCSDRELAALHKLLDRGIEMSYQPAPDVKRTAVELPRA